MALSQVQCLDDNHVNPRTHESKPEFLYCEDQRLALEAFLRDGREAFGKYLCAHDLRGFLSDPELETLAGVVEPYDPGSELFFPENAEEGEKPLSMHYWPELSDTSIPQMDLSWPDNISYRGVTRTTVYTQPPLEGQVHIKEVVRKMIAQAQKVIAVVMDVFTDVDIFRDLLDAGFKRKVSVYILLERTTLPHFQSMCQRANMHTGHLKNLRVRCTDGADFHSRSCTKVRGRMGHRFMFIDGDKAVSGSYSFTWMSSRLDKNLITVVTGQAVEAFDRLFCILYATSSSVDLRQVTTETEPELEPLPQPAPPVVTSAAMARKLYSPKYAMVVSSNPSPSAGPKDTQNPQNSKNPETKKGKGRRASKEPIQEDPPFQPGLTNLEKVCMMSYLPTWPEPDPPSDVIGFINVRDNRKPNQNHLQRSEMFQTSQAIRFSSPFSMPKETLPEVAKLRQITAKHEAANKPQPAQDEPKAEESVVDGAPPTQRNAKGEAEATGQKPPKCDSDTTKTLNTENKRHSNTATEQDAPTPRRPGGKACPPDAGSPARGTRPLPGAGTHPNALQAPRLPPPTDSDTEPHTQAKASPACTDSRAQAVQAQPRNSCDTTPSARSPSAQSPSAQSPSAQSPSARAPTANDLSSSLSQNGPVSATTSRTISASSPLSSSSIPPLTSSSPTPNPPPSSPSASSTPPVPKPRTVQLVIKGGGVAGEGRELPEFSVFRKPETSAAVHHEPVTAEVQTSPENVPETARRDAARTLGVGGAPQQEQSGTSRETETEEADGRHERNKAKSDVLITDAPEAESVNIQEIIPTDVEPETLMSTDCKLTPQIERVAAVRTETKRKERDSNGCQSSAEPNETRESVSESKVYLARAHVPQRISYSELTPKDVNVLESVDSLKAPVSSAHSADAQDPEGNPSFTPDTVKHNTHGTFQEQIPRAQASTRTPDRPQFLNLHDTHGTDFRSPTPERESRLLSALVRTPTPDGFLPRTPTPDSRTHTPDFRTPTSDGYTSPRTDSALSTNSEEFYECDDSPSNEAVFERASFRNHGATEDYVSFTHANTITSAATLGIRDRSSFGSETESLSGPANVSSLSSLKGKMAEENVENGGERVSVAEGDSQGTKRRTADHFKQGKDSTGTEEENEETLKRKKVLNQSAAEKPVDAGPTPGQSTNERTGPKRSTPGDLQPRRSSSERKRADWEKALGPSGAGRRDADGQKFLHTLPKTSRGRQRDSEATSPSRPSRPPRPLSTSQAPGPRQPNQAEGKVLHGGLQSARARPPPPNQHVSPKASPSQTASPQEAQWPEEGKAPFSFTLSKLYSLKGLRDKVNKGGSAGSPGP